MQTVQQLQTKLSNVLDMFVCCFCASLLCSCSVVVHPHGMDMLDQAVTDRTQTSTVPGGLDWLLPNTFWLGYEGIVLLQNATF